MRIFYFPIIALLAMSIICCTTSAKMTKSDYLKFIDTAPLEKWRTRMNEGDHNFSSESIQASKNTLLSFLEELSSSKSEAEQRHAFERAVKTFDELNRKYSSFIETLERDELGRWFNNVADSIGLTYKDNDVTWEWRRNW
jgi:hypothetical protein